MHGLQPCRLNRYAVEGTSGGYVDRPDDLLSSGVFVFLRKDHDDAGFRRTAVFNDSDRICNQLRKFLHEIDAQVMVFVLRFPQHISHVLLVNGQRKIGKTDFFQNIRRLSEQKRVPLPDLPVHKVLHLLRKRLGKVVPCVADGVLFSAVLHRMGIDSGATLCYAVFRTRCS